MHSQAGMHSQGVDAAATAVVNVVRRSGVQSPRESAFRRSAKTDAEMTFSRGRPERGTCWNASGPGSLTIEAQYCPSVVVATDCRTSVRACRTMRVARWVREVGPQLESQQRAFVAFKSP